MSDNKLVSKANALNEAAYTINLVAQRVIILALDVTKQLLIVH